ncbi:MAG TPA: hypothetical protein VF882_07570 [Gemmatimonadales bacterium]
MVTPLLALWTVLAAQAPPLPPPDTAAEARLGAAVRAFVDSLGAVQAAAAAFRADLGAASGDLVLARARRLHVRCAAARRSARPLAALFESRAREGRPSAAERDARRDLAELERVLARCERDYDVAAPAADPDTLKAWGPYRTDLLQSDLRRHAHGVEIFVKSAGKR